MSRPGTRGRPPCYEFIGGKGGVGKTTTAAALALGAAGAGRRTLVVSTDPAHSLGDALGRRLGSRVTRIPGAGGVLDALELDADRALTRWLRARRAPLRLIAERGTYLDETDVDRFLDLSFPGVDELGGLLELRRVAESGRYETVVVDTAPTGHTLRLLSVPEALQRIAAVLGEMLAKHHFLLTRLSGRDRLDAADGLVIEIDAEARGLSSLVRDPERCRFRWAVLPERLAVEEARDAVRTLARSGISIAEILVNRVTSPARAAGPFGRRRIAAERAAIAAVRKSFPNCPVRLVPELAAEPRGTEALRPLVRSLGRRSLGRELLAGPPPPSAEGRRKPRAGPIAVTWARLLAPPDVRLLLFVGKGGVGKTTCAAAMALALGNAAPGRRILLLSTDPAHSLGDVLAMPLGDDERRVLFGPGTLVARELDADRAFALRRDRYRAAVDELFDAIRGSSRFDVAFDRAVARDLLDLAPGGLDELCALLAVTEALFPSGGVPPRYELVVLDTAPTGHTLRLLGMPGLALDWVRALLATLLKYREVLALGALATDLVELSRGLRQLEALLRDARRARAVVVTRAAPLPRLETIRLLGRLERLGLTVSAIVVNALTPSDVSGAPEVTRAEAAEVRRLRAASRPRVGQPPLLLAPATAPPPRGVDALEVWGRTWTRAAS